MHIKIYVILCKINKTKKGFAERSLKLENTDPCVFLIKEINHVQFISLKKIMARFFNKNPSGTFLLTIELLYIVIPFKKHRTGEDFIDTLYNKCESNGNNWVNMENFNQISVDQSEHTRAGFYTGLEEVRERGNPSDIFIMFQ